MNTRTKNYASLRVLLELALFATACPAVICAQAQEPAKPETQAQEQPLATAPTIKAESRLVLVDAVVTDKKGNYIHDLKQRDFRVFEDNKEQPIASFSFGTDPAAPAGYQKHYMVLFFDNSSMMQPDQIPARAAAAKFIEQSASPDLMMAVVDFGGTLEVRQNFTANTELLTAAVSGVKQPNIETNAQSASTLPPTMVASTSFSSLAKSEADFGVRTMLLALRSLAKNLRTIQGRKMLILFSAGFPTDDPERISELTATIDACNKANVSIYPLDVRGLAAPVPPGGAKVGQRNNVSSPHAVGVASQTRDSQRPKLVLASFSSASAEPQKPGGGSGGGIGGGGHPGGSSGGGSTGAGSSGGGSGGGKGGSSGSSSGSSGAGGAKGGGGSPSSVNSPYSSYYNNPNNAPRAILPQIPDSVATNEQVLLSLAEGTGGFAIYNTNDLLGGLQRIGREQNEFYLLGYVPPVTAEGSCHTIKVKLQVSGDVRARSGYCNVRPANPLDGKPIEKQLELQATGNQPGAIHGSLQAPFFYSGPNIAQVNLAMEIPGDAVIFNKDKNKYHATVNVLGIAYKPDGTAGARFNDTLNFDLDKDEWKEFTKQPYHYQNQFDAAPGTYKLSVVLSAGGEGFAKFETPLQIDPYDGKKFTLGGVVLSKTLQPVDQIATDVDASLLEDRTPMIIKGMQITPAASYSFKKSDRVILYSQVYEPLLKADAPPRVVAGYSIVDASNKQVFFSGPVALEEYVQKGNAVVPFGLLVPVKDLAPGNYKLVLQAADGAHNQAPMREAAFTLSN